MLKPKKSAFMFKVLPKIFAFSLFLLLTYFTKYYFSHFVVMLIVLSAFVILARNIRYSKEQYIFEDDRIIHKNGGIFSDSKTELIISNLTHLTMKLPFVENLLFGTGTIEVESAGTSKAEMTLLNVESPEHVYDYLQNLMKKNGFSIEKDQLIQKEKPSPIGPLLRIFALIFVGLYIGIGPLVSALMMGNYLIVIGVLSALFIALVFTYLELKNRRYLVYRDCICSEEYFLTKRYTIFPVENLADVAVNQNVVERILGLYHVTLSCQGGGDEITFMYIRNGPLMEKNIDQLIEDSPQQVTKVEKTPETRINEYSMHVWRTIMPLIILLFTVLIVFIPAFILVFIFFNEAAVAFSIIFTALPIYLIAVVRVFIGAVATKFYVKKSGLEEVFDFMSKKKKEFTFDKITSVVIHENFIDKWFNTFSLEFWTIGSSSSLKFQNIKKDNELVQDIFSKLGIGNTEMIYSKRPEFCFSDWFRANIVWFIILFTGLMPILFVINKFAAGIWVILVLSAIFALLLISVLWRKKYYENAHMQIYRNFVYLTKGWLHKRYFYATFNNIKDISTNKYPGSSKGVLTFNVAGDLVFTGKRSGGGGAYIFTMEFVDGISDMDEIVDLIFHHQPSKGQVRELVSNLQKYSPEPIFTAQPDVRNSLTNTFLISVLIFPLAPLLPLSLLCAYWYAKSSYYIIEPYRVVHKYGIIFKKQKSIIFKKIDHINVEEGAINKLFGNGNIKVNTIGSSTAEMVLRNLHDYEKFYETLDNYY